MKDKEQNNMVQQAVCDTFSETLPLDKGRYQVVFYRNSCGACRKEDATCVIVHTHDDGGVLIDCEYKKLN